LFAKNTAFANPLGVALRMFFVRVDFPPHFFQPGLSLCSGSILRLSHSIHAITQDTCRMMTRTQFTLMFILGATDTTRTHASGAAVDLLSQKDEELNLSTRTTLAGRSAEASQLAQKTSAAQLRGDLQRRYF
jgi:hypothetical protein